MALGEEHGWEDSAEGNPQFCRKKDNKRQAQDSVKFFEAGYENYLRTPCER